MSGGGIGIDASVERPHFPLSIQEQKFLNGLPLLVKTLISIRSDPAIDIINLTFMGHWENA
ncbi:hypothetical protein DESC_590020 [Desulfosarcina cetonica]|nr:hypothetical protein DESC_590020 [Desulfosarcina cetonica]